MKTFRMRFKRYMHCIRVWGAILTGQKTSRISKLVDSILYELRLISVITIWVVCFYIFGEIIEEPDKPKFYQMMMHFNFAIIMLILLLVVKILLKVNKKNNTYNACNNPSHEHFKLPHDLHQDNCLKDCKYNKHMKCNPEPKNYCIKH